MFLEGTMYFIIIIIINYYNAFILVSQYCSLPRVHTVQICKFISKFGMKITSHLQI